MIQIQRLLKPTIKDLACINMLLPLQADKPRLLKLNELKRVTGQDCIEMYVAREDALKGSPIVGMASVVFYWVPTGLISFIEEFTVDDNFQGRGIGKKLINALIASAKKKKAKHISTYTNPKRIAANAVYQKLEFFKKETCFYRINLFLPKPSVRKAVSKIEFLRKERAKKSK